MAKQQKSTEKAPATLSTGTTVTASPEVIEKVKRRASGTSSSKSSK